MRTVRTTHADAECADIGEGQMGLILREQLWEAGLNKQAQQRRRDAGLLIPVLPGVFRLRGVKPTREQFALATHMWLRGRGVLSHSTSAALVGLLEPLRLPIEVLTDRSLKSPSDQIVIHRVKDLESADLRWVGEIRVTNPVRTIVDLAPALSSENLDFLIDEARRRSLIAERPLREMVGRLGGKGRPSVASLRAILDAGEFQKPVPGSKFERRFLRLLRRNDVREPERQVRICDERGEEVARVDFAYPDLKVAIECDSKKHHFGIEQWEHDLERRSRLAALGWLVIHVSWELLHHRPQELLQLVRGALGQPALL